MLAFHLWPTIFAAAPFRFQNICRKGVPPRSRTTTAPRVTSTFNPGELLWPRSIAYTCENQGQRLGGGSDTIVDGRTGPIALVVLSAANAVGIDVVERCRRLEDAAAEVASVVTMTTVTCWSHRCRVNTLFAAILVLGAYALVFDKHDDVTGTL